MQNVLLMNFLLLYIILYYIKKNKYSMVLILTRGTYVWTEDRVVGINFASRDG